MIDEWLWEHLLDKYGIDLARVVAEIWNLNPASQHNPS
jgi:hypothetical protein